MRRGIMLALSAVLVFAVVAVIMWRVMPSPLKNSDYLVIGSVATLVALVVLFFALMATMKSPDMFFKRRRK